MELMSLFLLDTKLQDKQRNNNNLDKTVFKHLLFFGIKNLKKRLDCL